MADNVYTVTVTHEVTDRLIRDIIIGGCEGGIGYWSVLKEYNGPAIDEGREGALPLYLKEQDNGDVSGGWLRLGEAQIVLGIELILRDWPNSITATNLHTALADGDAGVLDADDADHIIQCGVLGTLTYG